MTRNVGPCKYSEKGLERLSVAIISRAAIDFKVAAKALNKNQQKIKNIGEIRKIFSFINSDWFMLLTSANCSQKDYIRKMLKYVDKKYHKELLEGIVKLD